MLRRVMVTACSVAVLVAAPAGYAAAKAKPPSDTAIAKQALLAIADFPPGSGWQAGPASPRTPERLKCGRAVERVKTKNRRYLHQSPEFTKGSAAAAENSVYVFPKVKGAKAFLAPFRRPAEAECLQQSTQQRLKGTAGATVTITSIDTTGTGDEGVGFAVTVTAPNQQGGTDTVVLDAVAYRIGRAVVGFSFHNLDEPLSEQQALVQASVTRLTRALAKK